MTILFFSRLFYPHIGGVEKHVMEISKILIEQGHSVTVITEKYSNGVAAKEKVNGINVYRIAVGRDDWFKKFRVWKEIWKLRSMIQKADIVHCHDVFFWYLPFRLFHPRKLVYTTFHGYETICPPSQKAIIVRKISEKLSRGNICVGDFIKKWYETRPTFVTYGGVEKVQSFDSAQDKNSNLKIAFIGRLDADTGLVFYKQALQLLKEKNIKFFFNLYGDGELRKTAEKIGVIHGFVTNIDREIAKADIVFASSYLSIMESMMQKKLVFSTYSNPLKKDYLKMTPFANFIIIENDPEKLAEKIAFYVKNPNEKQTLVDEGFKWVRNQTWEKVVDTYLRLWKR